MVKFFGFRIENLNHGVRAMLTDNLKDGNSIVFLILSIVPGSPADIKVVVSSPQALFISWLPPLEPNGIITKYNLYTR